ncbi:MAG: DUF5131 family protein [Candidatus Bathyarchaeia archaeon]
MDSELEVVKTRVGKASAIRSIGRIYLPKEWIGREVAVLDAARYEKLQRELSTLRVLKELFRDALNCNAKGKKMFSFVSQTWNPVTGCLHKCSYCWARMLAETKLRNNPRYRYGFKPRINREEFRVKFEEGYIVFVSDMGDLFGEFTPAEWIREVLKYIKKFPKTYFLFLTKNPHRFFEFIDEMPQNAILAATIETDDDELYLKYAISGAPLPSRRIEAMKKLEWSKKFISIEPILDFNMEHFASEVEEISPIMVCVGYDNYSNKLPEPPLKKTMELIDRLSAHTLVIRKTIRPAYYEGLMGFGKGKNGN